MLQTFKLAFRDTALGRQIKDFKQQKALSNWHSSKRHGAPPDLYKQMVVKQYAKTFGIVTLVETGTFLGDMVWACKDIFSVIYSVELDDKLHSRAKKRFERLQNIKILHGDSASKLPEILSMLKSRAIFWLDAHYSAGITAKGGFNTPIIDELKAILIHHIKDHIILVDDARHFRGLHDYPTVEEVQSYIQTNSDYSHFEVIDDIIRISP